MKKIDVLVDLEKRMGQDKPLKKIHTHIRILRKNLKKKMRKKPWYGDYFMTRSNKK